MTSLARAAKLLDEVQSLAQLEAFAVDRFTAALEDERDDRPAEGGGAPDETPGLLAAIDRFAEKGMRIRLHNLTAVVPAQLRNLVATTIVAYEREPELLRRRVAAMLTAVGEPTGPSLTDQIGAAATKVLALRGRLREATLALAQRRAPAPPPPAATEPEEEVDATARRFALLEID